jgi:hypothetical protein
LYVSLAGILRAQGFYNAYAGVSRNVGYKQGAWHDVGWWELALQPLVADPPLSRSVAALQKDPSWPRMLAAGLESIRERS